MIDEHAAGLDGGRPTAEPPQTTSGSAGSDSYCGRPIVKPHAWTPLIPIGFWIGGMAGAAAVHAVVARMRGQERLANVQGAAAFVGIAISPVLLIADFGVQSRFLHILRVFKPTSPMRVGTWTLVSFSGATTLANGARWLGLRTPARTAEVAAATAAAGIIERFAVLHAGKQSARGPRYVVEQQRARIENRDS